MKKVSVRWPNVAGNVCQDFDNPAMSKIKYSVVQPSNLIENSTLDMQLLFTFFIYFFEVYLLHKASLTIHADV